MWVPTDMAVSIHSGLMVTRSPGMLHSTLVSMAGRTFACDGEAQVAHAVICEALADQHPWLLNITFPSEMARQVGAATAVMAWIDCLERRHGNLLSVRPLAPGEVPWCPVHNLGRPV